MVAYIVKSELDKFRRRGWRAYKHKKEYIEGMFGLIEPVMIVSMFYPIPHQADFGHCYFTDDDMEDLVDLGKEFNLKFLGTIHTHPGYNTCSHPSNMDINHAIKHNERLTGIVHLFKNGGKSHSRISFVNPFEPVQVKYLVSGRGIRNSNA